MYPMQLRPATKDYSWGGDRLRNEFSIRSEDAVIAEAWMLSCNPAGASTIMNGPLAGMTLAEALFSEVEKTLGTNNVFSTFFPILIKLIDARSDLSIQVHPKNGYALENEGGFGKTEMWYVLDAQKDAYLYYGFSRAITRNEMKERIENKTITEVLNRVQVKKGNAFFIEAGTIHAIGAGILIAEIQQNSNTTYRVYDYDRTDADGKKRELHIRKALDVTNTAFVPEPVKAPEIAHLEGYSIARLASCKYFTVDLISLDSFADFYCGDPSFTSLLFIEGEGRIIFTNTDFGKDGIMDISKGDSIFLPAGTGDYRIQGECRLLATVR